MKRRDLFSILPKETVPERERAVKKMRNLTTLSLDNVGHWNIPSRIEDFYWK